METRRALIWLTTGDDRIVPPDTLTSRWHVRQLNYTARPPFGLPERHDSHVGILDLTGYSQDAGAFFLERWIEQSGISFWIAILPGTPAANPHLAYLTSLHCSDYHTLPIDWDRLSLAVGHFWGMAELQREIARTSRNDYQQIALVGESDAIRHTTARLRRFARTSEPVLIYGDSGTGKEAAARFVHEQSAVRHGPLVVINCAALPSSLTQSELFGHEKGAFTNATQFRVGRLEAADGGSLLLLGIDELSLQQQSSLLRFLQEGVVERVGSNNPRQVRVRIIATASTALSELVSQGRFRSDVFFRLGEMAVRLPGLKERPEDILLLVPELLTRLPPHLHAKPVSPAAMRRLMTHSWPGNLRELQNRLRQALLLSENARIEPMDLALHEVAADIHGQHDLSLAQFRARAERQALYCSLALSRQNISAAARLLRISRASFYRLIDKYQLSVSDTIHPPNAPERPHRR
ncbi:sigma 54-interacting transcriptional regulator [Marinobacter zhanjiangensis]|uniref:Sigma-54-dependent Fis family transcriptional regulator n=1 Tax=Marinobacter zhanjiangensis TaxID=578215 RepID=A0ABQ3B899_9GAMM|nr:sigma-54 dependent transcriptional regulator [Marinobacter zhanjiangensis]GGY84240.1 sigma-54-dependent Fis family transcriptional regulator [Marinobacter zhanjiangensis]